MFYAPDNPDDAVADGLAVGLGLPFTNGRLTDYTIASQRTFGRSRGGRSVHGVRYLGLHHRRDRGWSSSLLYLLANRFGERPSMMTMIGAGAEHMATGAFRPRTDLRIIREVLPDALLRDRPPWLGRARVAALRRHRRSIEMRRFSRDRRLVKRPSRCRCS